MQVRSLGKHGPAGSTSSRSYPAKVNISVRLRVSSESWDPPPSLLVVGRIHFLLMLSLHSPLSQQPWDASWRFESFQFFFLPSFLLTSLRKSHPLKVHVIRLRAPRSSLSWCVQLLGMSAYTSLRNQVRNPAYRNNGTLLT